MPITVKVNYQNLIKSISSKTAETKFRHKLAAKHNHLPDFSSYYDHKLTPEEYENLKTQILNNGNLLKKLQDGKHLYNLETQQGKILAKLKEGEITQVVFPGFCTKNGPNSFNMKNGESRHQFLQRISDFEKDRTITYFSSVHHYPNGNGWKDAMTGKPPKEYMDKDHTTIKNKIETWLPLGGDSSELVQTVTADGKVQNSIARRYEWIMTNDENKYIKTDADGKFTIFSNGKKTQCNALKNDKGEIAGFAMEDRFLTPEEVMKELHLPEKWAKEIIKSTIKLKP